MNPNEIERGAVLLVDETFTIELDAECLDPHTAWGYLLRHGADGPVVVGLFEQNASAFWRVELAQAAPSPGDSGLRVHAVCPMQLDAVVTLWQARHAAYAVPAP